MSRNMKDFTLEQLKDELRGMEKTDEKCPKCGTTLVIYPEAVSYDDYNNALACPNCLYFERE